MSEKAEAWKGRERVVLALIYIVGSVLYFVNFDDNDADLVALCLLTSTLVVVDYNRISIANRSIVAFVLAQLIVLVWLVYELGYQTDSYAGFTTIPVCIIHGMTLDRLLKLFRLNSAD